jgi:hypothetical protein
MLTEGDTPNSDRQFVFMTIVTHMQHVGLYVTITCEIRGCGTISCEQITGEIFIALPIVPSKQKSY